MPMRRSLRTGISRPSRHRHQAALPTKPINRGCLPMHGAQVVIEQIYIAPCDLKRRWTVAEDPL